MPATENKAAPVDLGVLAPSGDRSDPFTQKQETAIMPQHTAKNHGCRFTWCENPLGASGTQLSEHFNGGAFIPATGDSLSGVGYSDRDPRHETLQTIGVGLRFNEDLEPAPNVFLNIHGGPDQTDFDLLLNTNEAVMLYNALGLAIVNACKGTKLSPKMIAATYSRAEND